jgi:hypothetical protein
MGVEIRAIAAERAKHGRKSPEYEALNKKFQALMAKYKESAPKK